MLRSFSSEWAVETDSESVKLWLAAEEEPELLAGGLFSEERDLLVLGRSFGGLIGAPSWWTAYLRVSGLPSTESSSQSSTWATWRECLLDELMMVGGKW
jgi:hypothetical protein